MSSPVSRIDFLSTSAQTATLAAVGIIPNTVDVRDFNAVGDGKTDNIVAIQKALDKAAKTRGRSLSRTGFFSAPNSSCHPLSASREIQRGATLNTPDPSSASATNQRPACWMSPAPSVFVSIASVWTAPDSAPWFTAFCWTNPIMANMRIRSVSSDAASAISLETASTCLGSGSSRYVTA